MNPDTPTRSKRPPEQCRRGMTLVEVLVAISLVIILASMVVVSGRQVRQSRMRASAEQQMALIAGAIEQYAAFWPRWEVIDGSQKVVVADKGWPDFIPGRLFAPGVFDTVNGLNNTLTFDVTDITYAAGRQSFESTGNWLLPGDVLNANSCLTYCLTAATGKGPFVSDKSGSNVVDIAQIHKQASPPNYPPYAGGTKANRRELFVDPWGTPYSYFWVYRDPEPNAAQRAYRGVLPVDYGAYLSGNGAGGVANLLFLKLNQPKKAVSFVLESAGPDKKFGNVWKSNPTTQELNDASDNLTIMPQ